MSRMTGNWIVFFCLGTGAIWFPGTGVVLAESSQQQAESPQQQNVSQRFRIDNRLVVNDKVVKSVTIFNGDWICDFIGDNGQVTIYDRKAGTVTLLDPSCRLKAQVTTEDLARDFERRKEVFRQSDAPFQNYLAQPYFEDNIYESKSGLMVFRSPWVEYRFETVALDDPVVSELYYDHCKQMALMNIRVGGAPTPMIRNELNPILEQNRRFPGKINVTFYPQGKVVLARVVIQAELTHTFVRRLQATDEAKLEQAKRYNESFREVSLDEYIRTVNE